LDDVAGDHLRRRAEPLEQAEIELYTACHHASLTLLSLNVAPAGTGQVLWQASRPIAASSGDPAAWRSRTSRSIIAGARPLRRNSSRSRLTTAGRRYA